MSTPIATTATPRFRSFVGTLLLLTLGCGAALAAAASPRMALAPGEIAPPLQLRAFPSGGVVTFGYDTHRLTAVNFWATWCQPCLIEMPALQRLHERFGDDGFRVIGVYSERVSWKRVHDAVSPLGITYQLALGLKSTDGLWGGIQSLPTTFLVDSEGRVVRRYVGATEPQVAGMIADVEAYLDGRPLPDMVMPEVGNALIDPGTTSGQATAQPD